MHAKKYLGYFSEFDDALQAKATAMGIASAALKNKYMESMKSMKSDDEPKQFKGDYTDSAEWETIMASTRPNNKRVPWYC